LRNEGIAAFREKAYPRIIAQAAPVREKAEVIGSLPAVLGLVEPEIKQRLEKFAQQIAQAAKADKVLIWFGQGDAYDFTYTFGFSDEELRGYHLNRDAISGIISKQMEGVTGLKLDKDKDKYEKAMDLMRACGMVTALKVSPAYEKWEDNDDGYIQIIVGRSEEYAQTYGELTEQKRGALREQLNRLIDTGQAPWLGIRGFLRQHQYTEFDDIMRGLRHGGVLKDDITPFIYRDIPYYLRVIESDSEKSQERQDYLEARLKHLGSRTYTIDSMDTFLGIFEHGIDFLPQDITPYVRKRVAAFEEEAKTKGLDWITEITDEELVVVRCDLNLLGILIDNLIENTIKYTPEGSITVRLSRKRLKDKDVQEKEVDYAVLEVEDTGIGIPEEEKSSIFKRGFRASNTLDFPGTGIGLDAAYVIVHLMLGDIDVESEVGKGTKFSVALRLAEPISSEPTPKTPNPVSSTEDGTTAVAPLGGIDFRALPITAQPVISAAPTFNLPHLSKINLSQEWEEINRMLKAQIIPSAERLKEYLQAACLKDDLDSCRDDMLSCIRDILRMEESNYAQVDPSLKRLLVLLESDESPAELSAALAGISSQPKEPGKSRLRGNPR
jgi:signal transduction histidine kinase